MTFSDDERHFTHYMVLLIGLLLFFSLFILFRYNDSIQLVIGGLGCFFYVLWGVIHHALEHRLTRLVVIEYVLFGGLMFLLLSWVFSF